MNQKTQSTIRKSGCAPLPDDLRALLTRLVEHNGVKAAVAASKLSPPAFARALAGLPINQGTVAVIRLMALDAGAAP